MYLLRFVRAGAVALGLVIISLAMLDARIALAQTAPTSTAVDFGPTINTVILPALVTLVLGVLVWAAKRFLGVQLSDRDKTLANDLMQKGLAFATAGLARVPLTVDVKSPVIADAARYVLEHGPDALNRIGISPSQLAEKLVARYMDPTVPVGVTQPSGVPAPPAA